MALKISNPNTEINAPATHNAEKLPFWTKMVYGTGDWSLSSFGTLRQIFYAIFLTDAIFPDVIEWDELRTRRRHEGIYYGAKNFVRKLAGAVAIFLGLQVLGWFGYQAPPESVIQFNQSAATLWAIRVMSGPVGAILLIRAMTIAWFYPITRRRHARIRRLLVRQRRRDAQV